jgi:hypothetical protein
VISCVVGIVFVVQNTIQKTSMSVHEESWQRLCLGAIWRCLGNNLCDRLDHGNACALHRRGNELLDAPCNLPHTCSILATYPRLLYTMPIALKCANMFIVWIMFRMGCDTSACQDYTALLNYRPHPRIDVSATPTLVDMQGPTVIPLRGNLCLWSAPSAGEPREEKEKGVKRKSMWGKETAGAWEECTIGGTTRR